MYDTQHNAKLWMCCTVFTHPVAFLWVQVRAFMNAGLFYYAENETKHIDRFPYPLIQESPGSFD